MNKSNLWLKLGGVVVVCLLCAYYLYPISRSLKLGIDLDGGYSLLYEIDDSGLRDFEKTNLANQVIEILKKRVDPDNVRNLVWRPIGNNRIEIQMPRSSSDIVERRDQFEATRKQLEQTNVTVADLYAALGKSGPQRQDALAGLARYDPERNNLFPPMVQAYDARMKAQEAGNDEGLKKAQADLDRAIDSLLATNFPFQRLMDALETGGNQRAQVVPQLTQKYPARKDLIDKLAGTYDDWAKVKSGLDDPSDLRRLLRGAGVLEFRILAEPGDPDIQQYKQQLQERGPRIHKGDVYGWFLAKPEEFGREGSNAVTGKYGDKLYVLAYLSPEKGLIAGGSHPWKLVRATPRYDLQHAGYAVDFQLDEYGGQLFGELTAHNLHKRLCILLDNEAISAPVIQSRIGTNGQITGRFSMEQAQNLAQTLNAGALPARLKEPPVSIRSVGPTLGATNRAMGLRASCIGLVVVVIFMAIYYLFGGLIADLAVAINLLITLGIMAAFQATFTLPGVAGLILSVGMAVDSNVLIFERFREESARGASLRLAVKYGYERAWRTILDSHVTTLISCAILYYFGSEDIKGFALVLGLGLLANLFTAVFMTRWIFELLLSYNAIKRLPMLHLIRHTNIDWWALRRWFLPISGVVVLTSLVLYFSRDPQTLYDIEFLGGTSAQIELKQPGSMTDEQVREMVTNRNSKASAVSWLDAAAGVMDQTARSGVSQLGAGMYQIQAPADVQPDLHARQITAFLEAIDNPLIEKNGIQENGVRSVTVATAASANVGVDGVRALVGDAAKYLRRAADKISAAQVQTVRESDNPADKDKLFEVVTTETNEYVVREAIVAVAGDKLRVEQAVDFVPRTNPQDNNAAYFPIVNKDLGEDIHDNSVPLTDVREYLGGVGIVLDDLKPAVSTQNLTRRLSEMRLQPDFEHYAWRQFQVIGLKQAGVEEESSNEVPTYSSVAVVVTDPNYPFDEGKSQWESMLAQPELSLTKAALNTERTLRKVVQFAPQVAAQTQQRAFVALILALFGISAYIWVRFGTLRHGIGAVLSLFHDVSIGMGAVALSAFIAYTPVGRALLIGDYKMNLTLMAALLTLVGYSLNDTIVVFDRIRENQGRLRMISPAVMSASVNQTLSRTILTSLTVFMVVIIMYVVGGPGIQGFAYIMTIGTIVGTYSSIAIASPLLLMFSNNKGRQGSSGDSRKKLNKVSA
jgi:SecD/SecF fusion protein